MRPKAEEKTEWQKLKRAVVGRLSLLKKMDKDLLKNARNDHGKSLLHVACEKTLLENVKYLVEEVGCDVNLVERKKGKTPLICALRNNNEEEGEKIVSLLVESKVRVLSSMHLISKNLTIAQKLGQTLIKLKGGSYKSYKKTASYMRKKGWSLDQVAYLQNQGLIKTFLSNNPDPCWSSYEQVLKIIAESKDLIRVKWYVREVSKSQRMLSWALLEATKNKNSESALRVKLLLDFGAPIDGFLGDDVTATPLEKALRASNAEVVRVLFEQGARKASWTGVFYELRHEMSKGNQDAKNCLRLVLEYRGLWTPDSQTREFGDIECLQFIWWNMPLLPLALEYLSRERQSLGPQDPFLPPNYYLKCFDYYDTCSRIVNKMKTCNLGAVTLYELLVKKTDELVVYTRNEGLMNKIKALDIVNKFPFHGKTLEFKLKEAEAKRVMIDESVRVLRTCLPNTGSDNLVVKKIVGYLGVPNLLCYVSKKK